MIPSLGTAELIDVIQEILFADPFAHFRSILVATSLQPELQKCALTASRCRVQRIPKRPDKITCCERTVRRTIARNRAGAATRKKPAPRLPKLRSMLVGAKELNLATFDD